MNIDNITIGELRQLQALLGGTPAATQTEHIGKDVIVRTYAAGVHFGTLKSRNGKDVELVNARRMYQWQLAKEHHSKGPNSCSELAVYGPAPGSKIAVEVPGQSLTDALEVIPCSPAAAAAIRGWGK